jgi:uncharacterized protein (DUF2147 family)
MTFCKYFTKSYFGLCAVLFSLIFLVATNAFAALSPAGYWKTIDDKTNTPRSIVQIWVQGGQLQGRIVSVYYRQGEHPSDLCVKCAPPLNKERILGMTMLWGMVQQSDNVWGGGQILDPKIGEIYHCKITVAPDGQSLQVRGYIGIPLLGRTQTWYRVHSPRG